MKTIILACLVFAGASAFAYKDGTYSCKNVDNLPNNVYTISTAANGLPYVDMQRFYHEDVSDPQSPVEESHVRGLAAVATTSKGTEILFVGLLRLQFEGDQLVGCKQ